jgi:hypothetical protein
VLAVGDDVATSKLFDMAGNKLDLLSRQQGCFQVEPGQQVYRFISGSFIGLNNSTFRSVCIFNDFNDQQVMENIYMHLYPFNYV